MAEADFEIDFYGEDGDDRHPQQQQQQQQHHQQQQYRHQEEHDDGQDYQGRNHDGAGDERADEQHYRRHSAQEGEREDTAPRQGVKRKSEEDDRPIDVNATAAIMISELNWWTTDDDIRGWLRRADTEADIKELTFSEHKVNGKSKGQAYVEFTSPQAATAAKHLIDQVNADGGQPGQKKISTSYWNPGVNPFRTLPKDAPARVKEQPRAAPSGPYNDRGNYSGGYRGRGNFNGGRGNMGQNNFNRNFSGGNNNMGFNNNMNGVYSGPMGGVPGGNNFGYNAGRGGMMGGGMRGGPGGMRGGRGGNMMGMNHMGGMPMGMAGNMGMGMMGGGGMGGFQGMPQNFGGNFGFGQNQGGSGGGGGGGGGDWGNPHGAKRPRPE